MHGLAGREEAALSKAVFNVVDEIYAVLLPQPTQDCVAPTFSYSHTLYLWNLMVFEITCALSKELTWIPLTVARWHLSPPPPPS